MNYSILQGDCIATMKTLPANSVQCVVTSPPYYSLRDYGTANWEGGDPDCDHRKVQDATKAVATSTLGGGKKTTGHLQEGYGATCNRCGARRVDSQIGLEPTPDAYVAKLVDVFREVRRLLRDDGTLWLNIGDSYNGSGGAGGDYGPGGLKEGQPKYPGRNIKGLGPKQLLGIPWRVAFALQADGWILRSEIIWHKRVPMPESVRDRPTKAHEQVFLLAKSAQYYFDAEAIKEPNTTPDHNRFGNKNAEARGVAKLTGNMRPDAPQETDRTGRNKRSVWTLGPESFSGAHFAVMPTKLVEPCILAGSKPGDTVLDPFNGAATVGVVALKHHRKYIGCELNQDYINLSHDRISRSQPMLFEVTA